MKICIKCEKIKPKAEFSKAKINKDGLKNTCKICVAQYRQENAKRIEQYRQENAKKIAKQRKQYRQENAEKRAEYQKQYRQKNTEKINRHNKQYMQERKKSDPLFKFAGNVRGLIRNSFKRSKTEKYKKQTKTEALLGCSINELHTHLAKQFKLGMNLDNHGEWHIDHIIPLASAQTQQDIERLCHYTNLQPLWAKDNLKKGSKPS